MRALRAAMAQSTPSPLRGGIKGGGCMARVSGLSTLPPSLPREGGGAARWLRTDGATKNSPLRRRVINKKRLKEET